MNRNEWTVLVVEDEYDSQQMVSKILNYHGVNVRLAQNGQQCLEYLDQHVPTIIVTDLAMPEMDGWDTLTAVRSNPATAHIPVVAITAFHSAELAEDALLAGFDACYSKPIDPRTFVDKLSELLTA